MRTYGKRIAMTWSERERFTDRITQLKKECGSWERFCFRTGISSTAVKRCLYSNGSPSPMSVEKIAIAFDVNPEWILGKIVERRHYGGN